MKRKQLAPHIHANQPASERYVYLLLALLPILMGAIFYYGIRVVILVLVSCGCFFASDFICAKKMYPEHAFYVDYSSLVSGLLLALMVPVSTSVWAIAMAALFGSLLVKQAFGGVGTNIFNPAMAARAFLQVTCPAQMTALERPLTNLWSMSSLITGHPCGDTVVSPISASDMAIFSGRLPGMVGLTSLVLLVLGGAILIERKLFRFEAPLTFFFTVAFGYVPFYWTQLQPDVFFLWLINGGILFVGFFMLNDCTTTPMDPRARVVFGGGTGILTLLFYRFGNNAYAMIFPTLMMNMLTPIFDFYLKPRAFSKKTWLREVEK